MLDYLVVGLGLAGISFCETLAENNKTFKVISDNSQTSSVVAGGLYNPVVLKRFTAAWKATEQLEIALPFYNKIEEKLGVQLDFKIPVLRRFVSTEEQNMWFEAMDKPKLRHFLSGKIKKNNNHGLDASYGYGEVLGTGRIDTKKLVSVYREYLLKNSFLIPETFDFQELMQLQDGFVYKGLRAQKIVFATGYGLKTNPFFNYLPLHGTKGQLLTIKSPELKEKNVIKSSVFIIPLGNDLYRVGATYEQKDKTNDITSEAKEQLLTKLDSFLKCDYELVDHVAGIRPSVRDRRPLVGQHPRHKNMYVLNGFGSRGVMIAPYASKQLYSLVQNNLNLDPEIDIERFTKKFYQ